MSVRVASTNRYICYTCLRLADMSLCSYPTNGLVSTIAPDHHGCILQLHMTSSHVFIRRTLSACTSGTVLSYQHPCMLHLPLTISHVCNICTLPFPMSLINASNQQSYHSVNLWLQACMSDTLALDQYSIHICYSNIQPSVLSVALATEQKRSNVCYNCTGQAGLYQPADKMVSNICNMQIPYLCCYTTLHKYFFLILAIHPADFFCTLTQKKVCTLIKHSVTKFSVISSDQYTRPFITSFF